MLKLQSTQYILPKAEGIKGDDACDYAVLENKLLVAVLCDGVGSARKGGAAARQSVKFFISHFKTRPKNWDITQCLTLFTQHINRLLFKESMTQYEQIELLTTLCVAIIEGDTLYTMNLGDSRIYLIDKNKTMRQLSQDHIMDEDNLSHVLTQACGLSDHVEPVISSINIEKGDTIVLCSDGLTALMSNEDIEEEVVKGLGAKLIIQSAAKGHKDHERDDISMQIFRVEELDEIHAIKNLDLDIPQTLKVGDTFDGYELVSSMMEHGRIWKVSKDNKIFVMKFPMAIAKEDPVALEAFVKEAWYAKQVSHKAFGDAWVPEDRSARYYLMELIEGINLTEYLKNSPITIDSAIALAKFLHKAEAHLLHLGLVHGDIKPENIIVYNKEGEVGVNFKMVDFGSVVEVFEVNSRAGTPSYLAPERFLGSAINETTEIFSIGVTLYWALTGKFPYGEIEPFQTPVFKQAKLASSLNKNIPDWFESIIMHCIATKEEDRYAHYSELFYALKSPEKVKPYYRKDSSFIEREPLLFYKVGFFILLVTNVVSFIYFNS
ncbi:bifunctional protein-serine/threonine kinase/phosphatase [Sulfurimonas sp. MAG313]|nr:bifunctional protein-serine/threonine kinase/phosphatase [Sulfurimonas sp. MAG313]MDF1879915.1 bifunctional protein-serine/threonine kinase/phosphatase [Sulfurimonas sp. MAG313]